MIAGRQSLPERTARARPAQPGDRHQPDPGVAKGILDHLLLDQDESGSRRALCDDIGIALAVHLIEPFRDACCHALLEAG